MKDWNRQFKNLGEVSANTLVSFKFEYLGDKEYNRMKPSCGCTTGKWDTNTLLVSTKIKDFPEQLIKSKRFYQVIQNTVTVWFKDGTSEILTLYATFIHNE